MAVCFDFYARESPRGRRRAAPFNSCHAWNFWGSRHLSRKEFIMERSVNEAV